MRKFYLGAALLSVFALASCTSDNLTPDNPNNAEELLADGYLSVCINMPNDEGTKADDSNDNFDDGIANEYAVNNGKLILFSGTDESEATIFAAYDLALTDIVSDPAGGQISTQISKVQKVSKGLENTYALVVLNDGGIITITGVDPYIGGVRMTDRTLGELTNATVAAECELSDFYSGDGILMTNAVLYDMTKKTCSILVDVTSAIQNSESEALANAVTIFVERAVAKVTVEEGSAISSELSEVTGLSNADITLNGWKLVNTNKLSYLVRNWGQVDNGFSTNSGNWVELYSTYCDRSDKYRFIGTNVIATTSSQDENEILASVNSNWVRTYWGIDPNYSENASLNLNAGACSKTFYDSNAADSIKAKATSYCLENTFDVAHMNVMNTTAVVVEATIGNGKDNYYTIADNRAVVYSEDEICKYVATRYSDIYDVAERWLNGKGNELGLTADSEYQLTIDTIEATVGARTSGITESANVDVKTITHYYSVVYKNASGEETSAEGTWNDTAAAQGSATEDSMNKYLDINCYTGGKNYYLVLIKHFGDTYCPWDQDGQGIESTASTAYAYPGSDADANFLGRYSVLRNNWYGIQVSDVKGLGYASDPSLFIENDGTPDDTLESYLAFNVNLLSWTKRNQPTVLQ